MSSSGDGSCGITQDQADQFQHVQQADEKILLGIQIAGGHIFLPILVFTIIFSRRVKRHPVFISFCASWILSSVLYSLLLYRGRSSDDLLSLNPTYRICLIQASLLNGVQALTVCTNLALVVHLWMLLQSCTISGNQGMTFLKTGRGNILYICVLLGAPFAVFVVFTIYTMVAGSPPALNNITGEPVPGSNLSVPGFFYCIILQDADFSHSLTPGLHILQAVILFSIFVSLITVCVECHVAKLIYKHRALLKDNTFSWLAVFLRILIFSIYRTTALGMNAALILNPGETLLAGLSQNFLFNGVIIYVQAAIPFAVFVVFASEKDILSVWCFWKKDKDKTADNASYPQENA